MTQVNTPTATQSLRRRIDLAAQAHMLLTLAKTLEDHPGHSDSTQEEWAHAVEALEDLAYETQQHAGHDDEEKPMTETKKPFAPCACACLGPVAGEPHCPCVMRAQGLPTKADPTPEQMEAFDAALRRYGFSG